MIISGYSKIDSDTFYDKERDGLNNVPYSTVVYGNGIAHDNINVEEKILKDFTDIDKVDIFIFSNLMSFHGVISLIITIKGL